MTWLLVQMCHTHNVYKKTQYLRGQSSPLPFCAELILLSTETTFVAKDPNAPYHIPSACLLTLLGFYLEYVLLFCLCLCWGHCLLLFISSSEDGSSGANHQSVPTQIYHLPEVTFKSHSRGPGTETIPSLFNSTLEDLTHGLDAGHFTSVHLVRAYKARSNELDDIFHAVIQWDSESETIAHALDEERRVSGPRRQVTPLDTLAGPSI